MLTLAPEVPSSRGCSVVSYFERRFERRALVGLLVFLCCSVACFGERAGRGRTPAGSLRPVHLETEALTGPIGVDADHPRLSWQLAAMDAGAHDLSQTAYRVLVASSPDLLLTDVGDVWDSARVESADQLEIVFAGRPIQPVTRYYWKVKTWDQEHRASAWSATASWVSGMLSPLRWTAGWIGAERDQSPPASRNGGQPTPAQIRPLPLFRREFVAAKPIARAVVAVCGLGQYELRINGKNVTASVMNPGWTNYRKRVFYNMYDVTALIRPGLNALGVMLGNGMYDVPQVAGRYTKFSGSFGQPKLILQLTLHYSDGSETTVVTDQSWKTSAGPITFSSIYGGEDYDARQEHAGWDMPGFSALSWKPVVAMAGPGGELVAQLLPAIAVAKTLRPVRTHRFPDGRVVYDLGVNFSGWPSIAVRGPAGSRVKLLPGELLDASGHVTQASNDAGPGRENSFTYTLKGEGAESWHPQFSYNGFRYVEVSLIKAAREGSGPGPRPPVVIALWGSFLHDEVAVTGSFDRSKPLFLQIHRLIDQAILSNMFSVLTDCPTREKLGWLEQTHLAATSIMYNYDVRQLYEKMADDMADSQTASGLVPAIAPEFVAFVDEQGLSTDFRDTPEWGSASILSPLAAYRFYGDKAILARHYDTMQRYVAYLGSRAEGHMLRYGLGDWYDIGPRDPGVSQLTSKGLTATAIYYQDLLSMALIARLLGHEPDARLYGAEAALVKDAFNSAFFHPGTGEYDTGSQTANAMPLVLGMVPDGERARVLHSLVADVRRHVDHVTAGDIGFHYVVRALTDGDRSDVLADMLSRTDAPSYGYQLAHGATSLTEAWDSKASSSQNHFMLGHAEEWFYHGLAGIDIDFTRPRQERLQVRPFVVEGVAGAAAGVETVFGELRSSWQRVAGGVLYQIEIPAGQSARITLPAEKADDVRRVDKGGGWPATEYEANAGSVSFVAGSGHYSFVVRRLGDRGTTWRTRHDRALDERRRTVGERLAKPRVCHCTHGEGERAALN
ncbi:MAG TPA: family 78 glycoside hydrolase catalytic domain [Acidisarcina sp.]